MRGINVIIIIIIIIINPHPTVVDSFAFMGPLTPWCLSLRVAPLYLYREFHYHMEPFHLREATDWGFMGGLRRLCMQQTSKNSTKKQSNAKQAQKWLQQKDFTA